LKRRGAHVEVRRDRAAVFPGVHARTSLKRARWRRHQEVRLDVFPGVHARTSLKRLHEGRIGAARRDVFPGVHARTSLKHDVWLRADPDTLASFSGRSRPDLIEARRRWQASPPAPGVFPGVHARTSLKQRREPRDRRQRRWWFFRAFTPGPH